MSDFEQRLRAAVVERTADFEPSTDLPDRITARVRRRHVQRRLRAAGGAIAAAAAIAVVVGVIATGGDEDGSIRMSDDTAATTTETTAPATSSTSTTAPTTTTTTTGPTTTDAGVPAGGATTGPPPVQPTGPALDVLTPENRQGIGPITAGMTVRQAQVAGGVTLVRSGGSGACVEMEFEGFDPSATLIVETTGGDVLDGIVRAVQGSVAPTDEGAIVGQSRAELLAALGSPTRTETATGTWSGEEVLIFESGGFAYGALVVDDMVLGLQSGDPAWVRYTDGCP